MKVPQNPNTLLLLKVRVRNLACRVVKINLLKRVFVDSRVFLLETNQIVKNDDLGDFFLL